VAFGQPLAAIDEAPMPTVSISENTRGITGKSRCQAPAGHPLHRIGNDAFLIGARRFKRLDVKHALLQVRTCGSSFAGA